MKAGKRTQRNRRDARATSAAATTAPVGSAPAGDGPPRHLHRWVALALFAGTFLLYVPSLFSDFVHYDDPLYVTENSVVQQGLTRRGLGWALTTSHFANWLPVTWLSHMLDVQLWGLSPAGHHATSNLLHAINAALLFLFLRAATGSLRRSAAAAVLFAVHPLRVESVAWIAERKDVLAATFFLLVLIAYVRYARRPGVGMMLAAAALHALGLMSKTMLVTVPGVLLLLDYWPLRRTRLAAGGGGGGGRPDADAVVPALPPPSRRGTAFLLVEKLPFVALAVIASAWTYYLQHAGGATDFGRQLTLGQRLANAVVSVPRYLEKMLRPIDLVAFYPHPITWPAWQVAASAAFVLVATGAAAWYARRAPWAAVGWFWFLGMLVPVSGIIQVGGQSMADRYTYLPGIGLTIAVFWGLAAVARRAPRVRRLVVPVGGGAAAVLAVATVLQQRYWASTLDLFQHALIVDERNALAHEMVGTVAVRGGENALAAEHLARAVGLQPGRFEAHHNYGVALLGLGRPAEAAEQFRRAVAARPGEAPSRVLLGAALAEQGDNAAAAAELAHAVRLDPTSADGHAGLGVALGRLGRLDDARRALDEALRLKPGHPGALKALQEFKLDPP